VNILFISTKSPYPLSDGHSQRTFHLLAEAAKKNNIYFLTFFLSDEERANFKEIEKLCRWAKGFTLPVQHSRLRLIAGLIKNVFSPVPFVAQKYRTSEMAREISLVLSREKIDVVHLDMLPLMNYYPEVKKYPLVMVDHNVESSLLLRQITHTGNIFVKMFWKIQYRKLYNFEKEQLGKAKCSVAVSEMDREDLLRMNPSARVTCVPNGVNVRYFMPGPIAAEKNKLIFVGGLNWFPNLDGMTYFCERIYPLIVDKIGPVETVIIGKANKQFKYASIVKQVGFVDDIRPYVRETKVYIVPLRVGGGTRLKILDALAMGKAIVSTAIGCEGLQVEHDRHLVIADEPQLFANAVVDLFANEQKRGELGRAGRQLAEKKYDWEILGEEMQHVYEESKA
jgi:glycosyltransferase involved in cell wall biosynthesis